MKPKKQTQIQRIKILEAVVGKLWNVLKQQGEKLKELDEKKCCSNNNKKK